MSYSLRFGRRIASLLGHFSRQSKRSLVLRGYLTVFLITALEHLTGPDFSFLIFYFLPIIALSWFLGKREGITIAVVAAVATLGQDLFSPDSIEFSNFQNIMIYWTFVQSLLVFLTVSIIVVALRSSEDDRHKAERKVARKVQSFLIPRIMPSLRHFDYSAHTKSSDHLSGDLFDCFLVGRDKLAFMIGDICGKGISAALMMAYIQGVLRSHAPLGETDLVGLMKTVNRSLHASTSDDKFATLFMGIYDDSLRTLTYVNAGHDAPRILRWMGNGDEASLSTRKKEKPVELHRGQQNTDSVKVLKLENGGLLLGVDPSEPYVAHQVSLRVGDILVCETDGLQEASNRAGDHYGSERLAMIVAENRGVPARELQSLVLKSIHQFVGNGPQADDMTLLIGKVV